MDQANESLGRKLAELELTEDEAAALVIAFGGEVASEVSGFQTREGKLHIGVGELQECTISKSMLGQIRQADWFVADSFSFGVEREMR